MFMKILIVGIISLSVATATVSINDLDIEKLKPLVPEGVLPDGIIPEGLNTTLLVDNARKVIKEKCQNVSNSEDAYLKAESAATVFQECLMGLVDYEALEKEIEEAKPKGDLDVVFNKYCGKRNIAIECMKVFTNAIEPCLDEKEVAGKTTLVKIFKNLLEFVCHKEGDQIALFIAEKGPECFSSKQAGLTTCINDTMFGYIPSETPSVDNLPLLVLGAQQCNDMDTLQQCIVRELNTCEETTPANIVEALLNYVRNETPCGNMTSPNSSTLKGNTAFTPKTSWTILSTALVTLVAWSL